MIDPGTDVKGEKVDAYCRRRWGGAGWTEHLKQDGRKDGAHFANWKWWPHTLKAHQLIQYCEQKSLETDSLSASDRINQLLFQAEYEDGENISDIETLVKIGCNAGIRDAEDLKSHLQLDRGSESVKKEISLGRQRYKISGVPYFVIGTEGTRPYGFSGAQNWETFYELFQELSEA